jgi:hypothetical protein
LAVPGHPRRVAASSGDRRCRHTCVGCFLNLVSHCSIQSDEENRLTVSFQRVQTQNRWRVSKPSLNQS